MTPSEVVIVHVDDEPHVLSALRRSLARVGWGRGQSVRIQSHTSASSALGTLLTETVDIVISDYRMPDMDGVELLRRARDLQPFAGRILLSGTTDLSFLLGAVNQAAVARVLQKPWVDTDLQEAVRQCILVRRLQLENAQLADEVRVQRGLLSQQEASLRRLASLHPEITEVDCAQDDPSPATQPGHLQEHSHG
jgi:two-component system, probable response regulator PhcQ